MTQFLIANPALGVTLIAALTSVIISAIYRLTVDQNKARTIKKQMKEYRQKILEAQKANNQKDALKIQKQMLVLSREQMRTNMKPMLVTFVVVIPIFIWLLPSLYQLEPVKLAEDGTGVIKYQGREFQVRLATNSDPTLVIGDESVNGELSGNEIRFSNAQPVKVENTRVQPIVVDKVNNMLTAKIVVATLPFALPFFGAHLGWLGWYIFVSLPLGILARKLMNVQ